MFNAYVGLGSNLGDPVAGIQSALQSLSALPESKMIAHSALYRSKPVGPQDQPDYVNAVACLGTELHPETLLDELQTIEDRHGRIRNEHWGPRTLDLDILLFDDALIATRRLIVPHPEMHRRGFVLLPLSEIAPNAVITGHGSVNQLLQQVDTSDLKRIETA